MKQLITALFLMGLSLTVTAQQKDKRLSGLDTIIHQVLKEWNVPGVSISIVEKNKVLFSGGFGYSDVENKKMVTENTQFAIGSCTKAFTASLLSSEMKGRQLDLDAPITTYVPALKFYNNDLTANVTLRDMLSHRTGLPRHDLSWYSGAYTTRDSLVYAIRYLEPSAPLRQTFQYNNYMYIAIANMLEKLNNKSWETLIQERLFAPLGMTNSTTGDLSKNNDVAYGYVQKNQKLIKLDFLSGSLKAVAPAGGIVSNAKDMTNWLLMWTNNGKYGEKEIVTQDFYRQAISSQMIASANLPSRLMPDYFFFNYGLGWYTANYRGHYGVGHGGNINGFSSFVSFFPTDSIGIYIAVNRNNSEVPRMLNNIIFDKLSGASYRDWNAIMKMGSGTKPNETAASVKPSKPSHSMSDFAGQYKNNAYGTITIQQNKEELSGRFNRWGIKIKHFQYNYFTFSIDENTIAGSDVISGEFIIGTDGSIVALKLPFETGVKDIEFKKQATVSNITNEDLKQYCGDYDFNGMVVKVYLTEQKILKALVPGQPEYELVPTKTDEFDVKGAKGVRIQFERDEHGNIPACSFIQPNGKWRIKRIANTTHNKPDDQKNIQIPSTNTVFAKYAGDYNMGGQIVKIFIQENNVMALLPGQPAYTLLPVKDQEFTVKGVNGYLVKFETNEKGDVTGFMMSQPNGVVKAIKK